MKKHGTLSKALAIVLTLMMTVGLLGMTAFAIEPNATGTITVSGVEDDVTVSVYRLMDVKINENGQPQDPVYTWTTEVAAWVRTNYPDYIGKDTDNSVQPAFHSGVDTETIAEFYDALAKELRSRTPAVEPDETREGNGDIEGLVMGNYLILIENGMKVYRPSAVNLVPEWKDNQWQMSNATVEVKSSELTITKTVNEQESDNASVGDILDYDIVTDIPQFPVNALAKNYAISDTLPDGLTLNANSLKVYGVPAGGAEILLTENTNYTQSTARPNDGGDSTFTLNFIYGTIKGYDKIHIEYSATLNNLAELGEGGNVNHAWLDYSNNPYTEDDWKSKEDTAKVYTYGLDISKVDSEDKHLLSGAEFRLYADKDAAKANLEANAIKFIKTDDGVYRKAMATEAGATTLAVGTSDTLLGKLTLKGLDEGTWYLVETKAPGGYNLLEAPVSVEIKDKDDTNTLDGKVEGAAANAAGEAVALVTLTVENDDGFRLPTTGGMGTILFTAVGVVLMGCAVVLLIVVFRKKTAESKSADEM